MPGLVQKLENEERLRAYANLKLHKPVEAVLAKLGVNGEFALAGGKSGFRMDCGLRTATPKTHRTCTSNYSFACC